MKKNYQAYYEAIIEDFSRLKTILLQIDVDDEQLREIKEAILQLDLDPHKIFECTAELNKIFVKNNALYGALKASVDENKELELTQSLIYEKLLLSMWDRFQFDLDRHTNGLKMQCIENDWVKQFIKLIEGQDVNILDSDQETFLLKATKAQSFKIIQELLNRGADPFIGNKFGESAFSLALQDQNIHLAKIYLDLKNHPEEVKRQSEQDIFPKDFYQEVAHLLQENSLQLDEKVIQESFMRISENYQLLGADTEDLWS
jgi:ankyrin repeat protein